MNGSVKPSKKKVLDLAVGLKYGEKTKCHYKNELGLEFDFLVLTKELLISSKRIEMEYSLFLEQDKISTHKITILFH